VRKPILLDLFSTAFQVSTPVIQGASKLALRSDRKDEFNGLAQVVGDTIHNKDILKACSPPEFVVVHVYHTKACYSCMVGGGWAYRCEREAENRLS
jgi:hypothetical protein